MAIGSAETERDLGVVHQGLALVGGDGHQLVVHVLLLTLRHVSMGVITILFL